MNLAPLSLAQSAYSTQAEYPSGAFFTQQAYHPVDHSHLYNPQSPVDRSSSHSPASSHSHGEFGYCSGSERATSPESAFLPTPAGSPKMADIAVNNSNWTSFEPFLDAKPQAAPAYAAVHAQQLAYQSMLFQQQQQYYAQPQQQQAYYQQQQPAPFMSVAPVAAPQFAPSYETPQGTYFFVPASVLPVTQAPPQQQMMAPSPASSIEHLACAPVAQQNSWEKLASIPLPPFEIALSPKDVKPFSTSNIVAASAPLAVAGSKKAPKKKNTTKRFVCPHPGCGRAFARNFNLGSHVKSHLGIRDFSCPACPKKFSRRHDRARHCAAVHDVHHFVDEEDGCDDAEA